MTPSHIGKYEIQRRLGSGGMGSLYLARDPGLDRLVALKLLKDEHQDEPELRERFTREARSVARLSHRHIIVVYEIGEDQGHPFMAMEYIAGDTLNQFLRRAPTPPIAKRLSLIEDLCDGLAHAHAAGIIHRDIKPANIMLDAEGVLKILDFGIARIGKAGITQDGVMMGTVNYMSPEQAMGSAVDHRSDIFATGAVLYEAIALEQAFPGWIDSGVLHRILYAGPVPLIERVPGIDPELAGIVQRALERDPNQRYQDLTSMRRDIVRVRRRLQDAGQDAGTTSAGRRSNDERQSDRRVLDPERVAKLRRQEVEDSLRFGEEAFARGDHDAALQYAERAAMADPDSPRAFDLLDKAKFAIEAKAIRQLLAEAQRLLAEGHLEDAAALVDEASVTLPDSQSAPELRAEVRKVSEKIAAVRDRERRIDTSLERARTSIEQGGFETALRAVYEVLALDPERPEARELEQLAKARLQAQRELERARRHAYDQLKAARSLADAGKFDEAADAISAVTPPSDTVRMAVADSLGDVRKLQREAAHAAIAAQAQRALDEGRLEQALIVIESIPAEDQTPSARSLRTAVEEAIRQKREVERKRQALEAAIKGIQGLIESQDLTRALERVEDAARIGLDDARIPALRQQISELATAAQEKRRQEARDRLATKRVEAARQLSANGDGYAAIALLERDTSGHPLVAEALAEMRVAVAEQEERVRHEAERKRKESEARQRAELEAAKRLEEQRKAAERQRQEEERRKREAEQQRRQQEVATLLISVERALAENRPEEATVLLKRADEVGSVEDTELLHRVAAAKAEAEGRDRRRRQLDGHLSRARELMAQGDFGGARQAADAALALDADHRDARRLLKDIADEETRKAEEAQRLAEARRRDEEARRQAAEARRQEEEARKREEALNGLLARAGKAKSHEAALTILNEASALAPGDSRVLTQLAERSEALERDRLEEQRRREDARRIEERQREDARKRAEEARRLEEQRHEEALKREQEARRREEEEAQRRQEEARRREEEARKREAAVADLIGQASQVREHDAALTLLIEAETLAPRDPRLRTLISERSAALEAHRAAVRAAEEAAQRERESRAQEERDSAAATAVENARQLFAQGHHDDALSLLRGSPAHALIQTVIGELGSQLNELERRRQQDARRRLREERRVATVAAIDRVIHDRRLQTAAAVMLSVILAWGAWRLWPTAPQQMSGPAGSASGTTTSGVDAPPTTDRVLSPSGPPTAPPVAPSGPQPIPRATPSGASPPGRISARGPSSPIVTSAPVSLPTGPAATPLEGESAGPPPTPRTAPEESARPASTQAPPTPVPQVPTPSPAPAGQRPATANLAAEHQAIEQLLNDFVAAYISMDDSRIRRIDPSFSGIRSRELIRSVRLSLPERSITVSPDGQSATLTASGTYTYVWNRAGFPPTSRAQLNWRLQKVGGVWTVVR